MDYFLPFYHPPTPQLHPLPIGPRKSKFLHKCTKNHDHMLYCSLDKACNGFNCYFSFWAFFFFFTLLLPKQPKKLKCRKSEKKPWRYHHFTTVYQDCTKIICYSVPETWCMTDVIIFHFGPFFALLLP